MKPYIIVILGLIVLSLPYVINAILSMRIKHMVRKRVDSMQISTKRICRNARVKITKTSVMQDGSLIPYRYELIPENCPLILQKAPNELLDSLDYNDNYYNCIMCRVYEDVLLCNNIEINCLADLHKALGLSDKVAIIFEPESALLSNAMRFISGFKVANSVYYNDELLYQYSDCIENCKGIIKDKLRKATYIRKWFLMPIKLFFYSTEYIKLFDAKFD